MVVESITILSLAAREVLIGTECGIEKLKTELEQKDLTIVAKDKHLRNKDIKISLLIAENRKLKAVSQGKDKKLQELQEKIKQLTVKNKSLIENSANLKSAVKNLEKIKEKQRLEVIPKNNNFLLTNSPNTLLKIDEPESESLTAKKKPEAELLAQVQV